MNRLEELYVEQASLERQLDNSRNSDNKALQRLLAVEVEICEIQERNDTNGTC